MPSSDVSNIPSPGTAKLLSGFYAVDPNGNRLEVGRKLYFALREFIGDPKKPNGSITIHCANGGVAGVESKKVYR